MKTIRFGAVYGAPPIFCADVDQMGYVEPESLPLSESLLADLGVWDHEYQVTFREDYPPDSQFPSDKDRIHHNQRGLELSRRLEEELGPDTLVEFRPLKD